MKTALHGAKGKHVRDGRPISKNSSIPRLQFSHQEPTRIMVEYNENVVPRTVEEIVSHQTSKIEQGAGHR